jgi:hypothetical protein
VEQPGQKGQLNLPPQPTYLNKIFLKGEKIQKRGKTELWFFGTALRLNAHYHCVHFKQIMLKDFQVMFQTSKTDGQSDIWSRL